MKYLLKVLIVAVLLFLVCVMYRATMQDQAPLRLIPESADSIPVQDTVFIDSIITDTVYVEMLDTIGTDTQFIND